MSFGNLFESEKPYSNPRNECLSARNKETSGFLCPLEVKDICERTGKRTSEKRRTEIYEAKNSSNAGYEATYAEINHDEGDHHHNFLGRYDFPKITHLEITISSHRTVHP